MCRIVCMCARVKFLPEPGVYLYERSHTRAGSLKYSRIQAYPFNVPSALISTVCARDGRQSCYPSELSETGKQNATRKQ